MLVQQVAKAQPKEAAGSARNQVPPHSRRIAPGNQAMLRGSAVLQPKLAIGRVDDPLEREADRAANQVVAGLEPSSAPEATVTPMRLSRKCTDCDEEDKQLQSKSDGTAGGGAVREPRLGHRFDHVRIHADAEAASSAKDSQGSRDAGAGAAQNLDPCTREAPAAVHNVLRSGGRPLDPGARAFMEPRFGHRFDDVRIHTDAEAASSARDVHANAYTVGKHVVFAGGQYAPETVHGRTLLAHELTHVLQQSGTLRRSTTPGVDDPRDTEASGEEGQNRDQEVEWTSQGPRDTGADAAQDLDPSAGAVPTAPTVTPEITLETGNVGAGFLNNLVHQQICVVPGGQGRKQCFSFAASGVQAPQFSLTWLGWSSPVVGAVLEGEVYHPAPVPGATVADRHTPTAPQAANWLAYMRGTRLGLHDGYSVARHNCRTFSQWEFRDAPSHW
ncbi:MAG: DUF4157 domain-containing protein [Pseudonocardiaceae bacterium]